MHPKWHKKLAKRGKEKAPKLRNTLVFDCSSLMEISGGLIPLNTLRKLRKAGWKIIICGTHEWTEEQLQMFAKRNFSLLVGSPSVEELQTLAVGTKKRFFISRTLTERRKVEAAGWQFVNQENFKSTRKYFQWGGYHWRDYKRPSLYRKHVEVVESFFKDKSGSLLDAGCGDGVILSRLNQNENLDCFGIDISSLAIEFALQHKVSNCTVTGIHEFSGKYDYIFAGDLFEHLECPDLALKRMHGWLPRGGILFSSVPIQTAQNGTDFHLFTRESAEKLFEDLFVIKSFEIRNDLRRMYIVAKKKIQRRRKLSQRKNLTDEKIQTQASKTRASKKGTQAHSKSTQGKRARKTIQMDRESSKHT